MDAHNSALYERAKTRLKMRLLAMLETIPDERRKSLERRELQEHLRQGYRQLPEEFRTLSLGETGEAQLFEEVIDDVLGRGPLEPFLKDQTITEIMVNGPHEIFIERNGKLIRTPATFHDTTHLMGVLERMLSEAGLTVNAADPVCDASLPDGLRLNVIIPPLVLNGPTATIRRKLRDWTLDEYVAGGAFSLEAAEFLQACVKAKTNLIISGGTSTGKTTLVSILSSLIPPDDRIITIENVAELDLQGREHWVRLVGRAPNLQGRGEISLRVLVKNALRMRPDRMILGEARGGEALDVVQAMHSGHDGVMTVLHANSPEAALERLETLMMMSGLDLPSNVCRMQIATAVDLVIHLARFADGSRRVSSISQVMGADHGAFQLEEVFMFQVDGFSPDGALQGALRYTGVKPKALTKFQLNNVPVPSWVRA